MIENNFVRIHEDVLRSIGVANDVVQVGTSVELFDGDAALVLNDSLEAPIDVADAGHNSAFEFAVISDHELIGIFHTGAWGERFTTGDQGAGVDWDSAIRLVKKVRLIPDEVRATEGIQCHARGSGGCAGWAAVGGACGRPVRVLKVFLIA